MLRDFRDVESPLPEAVLGSSSSMMGSPCTTVCINGVELFRDCRLGVVPIERDVAVGAAPITCEILLPVGRAVSPESKDRSVSGVDRPATGIEGGGVSGFGESDTSAEADCDGRGGNARGEGRGGGYSLGGG